MHDANIRVAIAGAGGRIGRQLIQAALALEGVQLGAALEREGFLYWAATPVSWLVQGKQALPCKAASMR